MFLVIGTLLEIKLLLLLSGSTPPLNYLNSTTYNTGFIFMSYSISLFQRVYYKQTDCLSCCTRPKNTEIQSIFCHVLHGSKEVPLV